MIMFCDECNKKILENDILKEYFEPLQETIEFINRIRNSSTIDELNRIYHESIKNFFGCKSSFNSIKRAFKQRKDGLLPY